MNVKKRNTHEEMESRIARQRERLAARDSTGGSVVSSAGGSVASRTKRSIEVSVDEGSQGSVHRRVMCLR